MAGLAANRAGGTTLRPATDSPAPRARGELHARYSTLLDAVRGLRWDARRRAVGAHPGVHRARSRGASAELTELRPYRQGDDVRRLDWRLLARTDRAYVRLSDEPRVHPTMLVLDASGSMAYPPQEEGEGKWLYACSIAMGLAGVALATGDPVGVAAAASGSRRGGAAIPPRSRRGTLGGIARALAGTVPGGAAPVAESVRMAARTASRLVVLCDLLGDEVEMLGAAREHIAAGGEVYVVHIVAAAELNLPRDLKLASDPEDPSILRAVDARARAAYTRRFAAWREDVASRWRHAGVPYILAVAGLEAPAHTVRRVVLGDARAGAGEPRDAPPLPVRAS